MQFQLITDFFHQTGDMITADCLILDNNEVSSNESGLTGEPKDMRKSKNGDCFLLSSCLLTEGEGCKAVVIGIGERSYHDVLNCSLQVLPVIHQLTNLRCISTTGMSSQWGKIKANLVTESVNTPLQDKLERMTTLVRSVAFSTCCFNPVISMHAGITLSLFISFSDRLRWHRSSCGDLCGSRDPNFYRSWCASGPETTKFRLHRRVHSCSHHSSSGDPRRAPTSSDYLPRIFNEENVRR